MRKWFCGFLLLFVISVLLVSCGDGLVSLKYDEGKFVNPSENLSYLPAPVSYEPVAVGEAYAYYKKGDITMYAIPGTDPALWLTEEYADSATTVFYSEGISLPALSEFGADTVYVCVSEERTYAAFTIRDDDTIASLVDFYVNGETADVPSGDPIEVYDLKFSSPDWPMIYISLEYEEYESGAFLYDRGTRRYMAIGDLLDGILHEGET